mgnify:CR=1 FL=1
MSVKDTVPVCDAATDAQTDETLRCPVNPLFESLDECPEVTLTNVIGESTPLILPYRPVTDSSCHTVFSPTRAHGSFTH